MIDAIQTGASGLSAATGRFGTAAAQVAALGSGASLPDAARIDLSRSALDMIEAKANFGANLAVIRTADAMTKRLLDVKV